MVEKRKRWITDWWPHRLNLKILRQHCHSNNPYGHNYDYISELENLILQDVKEDLKKLMKESQEWWPADFGHYGGLFIRLAWHSAGSYRIFDGRGGARAGEIRFPPRINWPDNISLDKAIKLLWPIKQKYGKRLSWADLIILAGDVAFEDMGVKTLGVALGREDIWEPDESTDWGPEIEMLSGKERFREGELEKPFAATEMGLIYVNPEGPDGNPDPVGSAKQIRVAFSRMGMNDEETVALIAGGHAFGKCHGAGPDKFLGPDPSSSDVEAQGLGWKFDFGSGKGPHTFTSGFEITWSATPTKFGISYLKFLFTYEWELTKSPAGKYQWVAKNAPAIIPDAHDPDKKHPPMMLTADLALKFDPVYSQIAKRFLENPKEFEEAFTRAWFKLIHRDMGPKECYFGTDFSKEDFIWQDPLPPRDYELIEEKDIEELKEAIKSSNLSSRDLLYIAFSSAITYRDSDRKGGANGARIRLNPMKNWEVNHPERLKEIIEKLEKIKNDFDTQKFSENKKVSIADLIVLSGIVALEECIKKNERRLNVPFYPGRRDALQEQIDIEFYNALEPDFCGFRNYIPHPELNKKIKLEELLVDKAQLLKLTVPELVCLYGGIRTLGINFNFQNYGVLTERAGVLSNDFFVNLLDMKTEWKQVDENKVYYEGYDRKTGALKWKATRIDLIFGHHEELRSVCEVYAAKDGEDKFIEDFVRIWTKLMHIDRFDIFRENRSLYKSLIRGLS